jgi:hypothetical protein
MLLKTKDIQQSCQDIIENAGVSLKFDREKISENRGFAWILP